MKLGGASRQRSKADGAFGITLALDDRQGRPIGERALLDTTARTASGYGGSVERALGGATTERGYGDDAGKPQREHLSGLTRARA